MRLCVCVVRESFRWLVGRGHVDIMSDGEERFWEETRSIDTTITDGIGTKTRLSPTGSSGEGRKVSLERQPTSTETDLRKREDERTQESSETVRRHVTRQGQGVRRDVSWGHSSLNVVTPSATSPGRSKSQSRDSVPNFTDCSSVSG